MDLLPKNLVGLPAEQVDTIALRLTDAIRLGRLRPGERLPTIRAVAARTGAGRNVVQRAYRQLAQAGLVTATVGRGTVVSPLQGAQVGQVPAGLPGFLSSCFSTAAHAALQHVREQPEAHSVPAGVELVADFANLLPDETRFPLPEFRRSLQRVLETRGGELLLYGEPAGSMELRSLLADDETTADEILITSGAQQGMDLVLRTFTEPGDAVAVALPTYHHLFGLLKCLGLRLVAIDDLESLPDVLEDQRVRLLYVMPTFHNPTGRTMDLAQRKALMAKMAKTDVPVLEDEFELELRFAGERLPSLRSLDPRGLTVTVRTFSKGLFPGVRIGWLQATAHVLERMAALKRFLDLESSPLLQAALADFIRSGARDRYLQDLQHELQIRHRVAQEVLPRVMPDGTTWTRPEGGYALWLELPQTLDGDQLAARAAAAGVAVTPGSVFHPRNRQGPNLRLSLSRVPPEAIEVGLKILGERAQDMLDATRPARSRPLFL